MTKFKSMQQLENETLNDIKKQDKIAKLKASLFLIIIFIGIFVIYGVISNIHDFVYNFYGV